MQRMLDSNANGVSNQKGFYEYDDESAQQWVKRWTQFTWQIRELADHYVPVNGHSSTLTAEALL